jgi:O-antigen/teichoic acid export membrane protein
MAAVKIIRPVNRVLSFWRLRNKMQTSELAAKVASEGRAGSPLLVSALGTTTLYAVGVYAAPLAGLFTFPLYATSFSTDEFLTLARAELLLLISTTITNSGFPSALLRFAPEHQGRSRKRFYITSLLAALVFEIAFLSAATAASLAVIPVALKFGSNYHALTLIIFLLAILDGLNTTLLTILRLEGEANKFAGFSALRAVLTNGLAICLVMIGGSGPAGVFLGGLAGSVICVFVLGSWILCANWVRPSLNLAASMVRFSWPYIPLSLLEILSSRIGFIVLDGVIEGYVLASYVVAEKVGSLVALAYRPLGTIVLPIMYGLSRSSEAPQVFAKIITILTLVGSILLLLVSVSGTNIAWFLSGRKYIPYTEFILPLALSATLAALRPCVRIGIAIANATYVLPVITGITVCFGYLLTVAAAWRFHATGAAWATGVTAAIIFCWSGYVSQLKFRVPFEWGRMLKYICCASIAAISVSIALSCSRVFGFSLLLVVLCLFAYYVIISSVALLNSLEGIERHPDSGIRF